jgi:hypothetical protein
MRKLRVVIPVFIVVLLGGLLAGGAGAARKGARKGPLPPKAGKYVGKVGTFARIVFSVNGRKRAVVRFNAGVKTNCQRTSDGLITETKNLATAPGEQEPAAVLRVKKQRGGQGVRGRRWHWGFAGTARDKEGVEWAVEGEFLSRVKARGAFQASRFESIFNPLEPLGIDGQLCAGSGKWAAVWRGGKKRRRGR